MRTKICRKFLLAGTALGLMFSAAMTVSAHAEDPDDGTEKAPIMEETPAENEATPFSLAGNGELVDDKTNDGTKEFLTIQTKNNNTFFLVLDRSSTAENVYMLSMIDEGDLAEFLEEEKGEEEESEPAVILEEPEDVPESEEPEPEEKTDGMNVGMLLAAAVVLAGGAGGYYYLKVLKPKKNKKEAEDEDLEFYDGGTYINEDGEEHPDQEEE